MVSGYEIERRRCAAASTVSVPAREHGRVAGSQQRALRIAGMTAGVAALVCTATALAAGAATPPVVSAVIDGDLQRLGTLLRGEAAVNAAQPDGSTALHWAAYRDDAEAVQILLNAGADPDAVNLQGVTPLIQAAISGNARILEMLLDAGADIGLTMRNGETALMMAARTGSVPAVELLLARGAAVDATESLRGTTALMWAASYGSPDAARALIEHGADVQARSATTARGRGPYMAPPARERIREFIEGTGLRGAAEEFDFEEADTELGMSYTRTPERIAAAVEAIGPDVVPDPARNRGGERWGGLPPLIFAARHGHRDVVEVLVAAGADVNQTTADDWTALLAATHNRYYELGAWLLEQGADPNIANAGGWTPLYIATDNRNIEAGDYPVRQADMDHLAYIRLLLDAGADPNLRMRSSTETRTVFTQQWLFEDGATPFLRASQSGDLTLMKLLLEHGADPTIPTLQGITPLMVASGVGWVHGVTHEWSAEETYEAVKFLIEETGAEVNARDDLDGRTALMGAAHKGAADVVQLLVDHGADLSIRDIGSRDSTHLLAGVTWKALDYAEGLVRVGVQSASPQAEAAALIRELMIERGLPVPPEGRTLESICVVDICQ
jgi:uncharacterized protein